MPHIVSYLNFDGNCAEAMTFYHACLGGTLHVQTFADSPMAADVPPAALQRVVHARLDSGDIVLMASDTMPGDAYVQGNAVSLSLHGTSGDEITRLYGALSAGGSVTLPLGQAPWSEKFGMFVDKFGISWLVNLDRVEAGEPK